MQVEQEHVTAVVLGFHDPAQQVFDNSSVESDVLATGEILSGTVSVIAGFNSSQIGDMPNSHLKQPCLWFGWNENLKLHQPFWIR